MTDFNKDYKVPFVPSNMPFDESQQQWLGGFLAGLHSRLLLKEESSAQVAAPKAVRPLTIIYGSQTGNAEGVAYDCAELAKGHGLAPQVLDMDDVELPMLAASERLLLITSTYGEGEMPDNAQLLWDAVESEQAPSFANTYYSVLALGDTSYDEFCLAGILWDKRLEALGGKRIAERVDCDGDFAAAAESWMAEAVSTISQKGADGGVSSAATSQKKVKSQYNRKNPLQVELIDKRVLSSPDSSKEICHFELSLGGSGETYKAGDALNIIPANQPVYVAELLQLMGCTGEELEPRDGESVTLKQLLTEELEIRTPSKEFLAELSLRAGNAELVQLLADEDHAPLNDFLYGKDIVDLLKASPLAEFSAAELLALLKPIAARAYSISSSIKKHDKEVHLTVSSIRYEQEGREHSGVCSTYLADLVESGDKVKCYFVPNKSFAVPENDELPIIMVGPGTGVAPFRAFLEEREVRAATGSNWLFFGDRNSKDDFIYRDELEVMQASGLLTRLDLAFSRDQPEKIYVQDRMLEQGAEFFAWLERGAYFYICGDAYRMAKDVDKALRTIVAEHGSMDTVAAEAYVNDLKKTKRYVRDVY
jgi:sulfite reductase (NADPH) flavoprotein alpha-component|tara:strand:- start:1464 stop:3242 length:1779 start_codon:yes stop_codon:yes gene_type:complete